MESSPVRNAAVGDKPQARMWRCRVWTACLVCLCAVMLWPYAISIGASGATFTLVNKTPYYLHAVINNMPTVYLAPGGVVNYDAGGLGNVSVEVRYSPGQQSKGSATRSFEIVYHTTYSQNSSNTCNSSNKSSSDCSTSTEASSTTTADPVRWEVTTEDLTPSAGVEP